MPQFTPDCAVGDVGPRSARDKHDRRYAARPAVALYTRPDRQEHWLEVGARLDHLTTAGTCRRLLRHHEMLWTFTRYEGVDPTNNAVERALRHGVIWRKLCYGTASERGSRFVERLLTVIATARQQNHELLDFLRAALRASRHGEVGPPLLPAFTLSTA